MKKYFFLFTALMFAMLSLTVISCGDDDDDTSGEGSQNITGTWQGTYSGYDSQQSKTVYIRRQLTINSDGSYSNTIGGNTTGGNTYDEWEKEAGSYSASNGIITFRPSSDQRVDFSTKNLVSNSKSSYTERIQIESDGSWTTKDESITASSSSSESVTFSMKRQ